ncbi:response regulator [Salinarimonas soli]|uniref:Response regulator n=1 Tax=Salinarimonas soli TaxID=1638099 RepID=A0A5B2VF61_9HYPH|nr:response regulator [Salinarimonas soli]KAA2237246.1 response regulator [Salinarimonas soli]
MPPSSPAAGHPLRLVIVEDEALLAMSMEDSLLDAGHEVLGVADDLASALALAGRTRPDLALVDVQLLRGSSGLDVAARFAELGIPCLFVTGNCPAERGRTAALGCLHKPADERSLLAAVVAARAVIRGEAPCALPSGMHLY